MLEVGQVERAVRGAQACPLATRICGGRSAIVARPSIELGATRAVAAGRRLVCAADPAEQMARTRACSTRSSVEIRSGRPARQPREQRGELAALRRSALLEPLPTVGEVGDRRAAPAARRACAGRAQVRDDGRGRRLQPRGAAAVGELLGVASGTPTWRGVRSAERRAQPRRRLAGRRGGDVGGEMQEHAPRDRRAANGARSAARRSRAPRGSRRRPGR